MVKKFKNYVNPHQHAEYSIDGGSTVEAMIDKDRELKVGYSTLTDHGTMAGSLKHYTYCKKKGIKPIVGLEAYFHDPDCPIIKGTESEELKYFHMTMHFCDSKAFHKGVELLSDADKNAIIAGGERKPLFKWKDLEELSQYNVTFCSSCVIGMVGRHLMVNRPDLAEKYYIKIRDMVGKDKFYVEVFAHVCDHYWQNGVRFTLEGGDVLMVYPKTRLDTNGGEKIYAQDIAANPASHTFLKIRYYRQKPIDINKSIIKVERVKDFVKQDSGDIQLKANEFMLKMARKYKDKIIISDDAHYANKEDKVVQNMKLGEGFRFYGSYHRHETSEVTEYFKDKLNITEKEIEEWIENSYDFASHFDDFSLEYKPTLPTFEGDTFKHTAQLISKHDRMDWNDKAMIHRLKYELDALHNNGTIDLLSYNFPIEKVCDFYKNNGLLTGPGRGSATGSLLCYLLNITQINPLKFDLPFERYISPARIQNGTLPDIDLDLPSRDLLVGPDGNHGYLHEEYGDRVAQISTDTMMRLKSAIKDINRFFNKGHVDQEIEYLTKGLPTPPQGVTDHDFVFGYENSDGNHVEGLYETSLELQEYASKRPEEWSAVVRTIGINRQKSRHACFAAGTLIDDGGTVGFIEESPDYSINKPIQTWYSGVKNTIIVSMNNGVSLQCTPDHEFIIHDKKVEAKDLVGETISYKPFTNTSGLMTYNRDYCFAWGWFLNDGAYIKSKNGDERFEFYFTPNKDNSAKKKILDFFNKSNVKITPDSKRKDTYKAYGLDFNFKIRQKTYKKRLPKDFWDLDLRCQRSFMLGLFSANGYCLSTRPLVAIKLTSKLLISDIAIWLNSNDIETSCSYSKPVETEHRNGTYISRSTGTLSIPHFTNKRTFENLVGFYQSYKSDRLREIIEDAKTTTYIKKPIKCLSVEESERKPVWDFNEPLENVGYINGILVHNCAYVIGHKPIKQIVPTCTIGGVQGVTQYTAKWVEEAGLIKYDFLVINSLNDITQALMNIKNKYGHIIPDQKWDDPRMFPHNGEVLNIWALPEDPEVYKEIGKGKNETVFQLNTAGVTPTIRKIQPKKMMDLATITALERPGPKNYKDPITGRNMVEEYIERRFGRVQPDIPYLAEILPDTYGVICFQEQLMTVGRKLAGFNPIEADDLRRACAKKKMKDLDAMKPRFMEVATTKVGKQVAEKIWNMMITFGRYGFSINHAVPYVHISYACAFLKFYYSLEWWAAVLTNAKKDEIVKDFWPYVKDLIIMPDINKSGSAMEIEGDKIRASIDLLDGVGETAKDEILSKRPFKDITDFVTRIDTRKVNKTVVCSLIVAGVLDSLFENNPLNEHGKMLAYMEALTQRDYDKKCADKQEKCKMSGKEYKAPRFPKTAPIPDKFTNLNDIKLFQVRKNVLPTIPQDIIKLIRSNVEKYSNLRISIVEGYEKISAFDKYEKYVTLINADGLRRMKNLANHEGNIYFCVPCYTVDVRKFSYQGGTKHAAELKLDVCGSIESMVRWGDYETGILDIPHNLKGSISLLFLTKKPGKDPFIYDIVLLEEPLGKSK